MGTTSSGVARRGERGEESCVGEKGVERVAPNPEDSGGRAFQGEEAGGGGSDAGEDPSDEKDPAGVFEVVGGSIFQVELTRAGGLVPFSGAGVRKIPWRTGPKIGIKGG